MVLALGGGSPGVPREKASITIVPYLLKMLQFIMIRFDPFKLQCVCCMTRCFSAGCKWMTEGRFIYFRERLGFAWLARRLERALPCAPSAACAPL